ncbi:hypothetical protein KSF_111820 [Reticulibacter mediterranei]|uniref:Uncharacterized protein n=1 Tax=Reticulibacter mediterranei TaxID=2778369 RepID=A0A8J3J028_9CHLR|nr:hypothetical protein [Reticulibacter mediterranei]GHP01135.1 hypothetical protein KSF_111820 [Reticulibacter mediterranei]
MIQTHTSITTSSRVSRPASHLLTWGVVLSSAWFGTGLYLDGWAHTHDLPDTFFTPWHGVIYSGFFVAALFLVSTFIRQQGRHLPMPTGYGLSLIGVGLFLVGGGADLIWHTFLGIEANLSAEYSPPHLILAAAGLLITTGPLRAAWHAEQLDRSRRWAAVLSLAVVLSTLTFFTSEFHPFDHPWAWTRFRPVEIANQGLGLPAFGDGGVSTQDLAQAIGVSSIVLQSALLVSLLLFAIRRFGTLLPSGALLVVLTLNGAVMSIPHGDPWVFPLTIVAGTVIELLYRGLRPVVELPGRLRLFAVLVPVVLFSLYFLTLFLLGGVWWPIPLWTGAILLAGVVGWFVSYLVVPPAFPEQ